LGELPIADCQLPIEAGEMPIAKFQMPNEDGTVPSQRLQGRQDALLLRLPLSRGMDFQSMVSVHRHISQRPMLQEQSVTLRKETLRLFVSSGLPADDAKYRIHGLKVHATIHTAPK
jgi:hypothetical protein